MIVEVHKIKMTAFARFGGILLYWFSFSVLQFTTTPKIHISYTPLSGELVYLSVVFCEQKYSYL